MAQAVQLPHTQQQQQSVKAVHCHSCRKEPKEPEAMEPKLPREFEKSLVLEPRFEPDKSDSGAVQASEADPSEDPKDFVADEDAADPEEAPEESQGVTVVVVL